MLIFQIRISTVPEAKSERKLRRNIFPSIISLLGLLSGGKFCLKKRTGKNETLEKLLSRPGARPAWLTQIIYRFVIVINVQLSAVSHFYLSHQSLPWGSEDTVPPVSLFTCFPRQCTSHTTVSLSVFLYTSNPFCNNHTGTQYDRNSFLYVVQWSGL